jgi:hypothetical protein
MLGVLVSRQPAAFLGWVHRGLMERRPVMGELLAALIFGVIIFGFTALMLIPLFFAWLMVAVYREPAAAIGAAPEPPTVDTEPPPEVEEQLERPKVMVAGRRRPLP